MEATRSNLFTHGYALLIGVDQNSVPHWALPDVAKDVRALAEVLVHPQRCAYPKDNVKTLTGPSATRDGILQGLDWLQGCLQGDTSGNATAVIYYTGHGWREQTASPDYYFIPYDVRESQIKSRGLRTVDFAEAVSALKPKRLLVVLDCCHAGGMGVKDVDAPPTDDAAPAGYVPAALGPSLLMSGEKGVIGPGIKGLETLAQGSGRAVLSSSTGEQKSYLRMDRRMSIFTYHFIEALTGHAQPQDGAAEVLVSDVMGHVSRRVPQSVQADFGPNCKQEPDYQVSGNFPIALLLGGQGLSKGQPAPDPLAMPPTEKAGSETSIVNIGSGAVAAHGSVAASGGGIAIGGDVHGGINVNQPPPQNPK